MRQTARGCPERTRKAGTFSCSVSPLVVRERSGEGGPWNWHGRTAGHVVPPAPARVRARWTDGRWGLLGIAQPPRRLAGPALRLTPHFHGVGFVRREGADAQLPHVVAPPAIADVGRGNRTRVSGSHAEPCERRTRRRKGARTVDGAACVETAGPVWAGA